MEINGFSFAEFGHFALCLGLSFAFLQALLPLIGVHYNRPYLMNMGGIFALMQFLTLMLGAAMLVQSFLISDFSLHLVASHSHSLQPLLYKVSASWGNHEGSLLLWSLVLAFFGLLVAQFGNQLPDSLKARTLAVQGMIAVCFLSFLLFTSNPFTRILPPPLEGQSLNPLLQDPGLAFHPPLLYLGYVGLSLVFSLAIAALLEGKIDAAFARWMRPWVLLSWGFLTAGIALGSWWAYYELGWGGFWFWDPVENASLMPWLATTALLHTAIVMEKRGTMKSWTILLAIIAFGLSLIGTFLVRSGVLTSVHAFANDPERGIYILMILFIALAGGLGLYAVRAPLLKGESLFQPISREGALMLNNILLVAGLATVLLGTLYPLFLDAMGGDKLSVGAPYFNQSFLPLMLPLVIALGIGPLLGWKRGDLPQALRLLKLGFFFCVLAGAVGFLYYDQNRFFAASGLALAVWLIFASLTALIRAAKPNHAVAWADVPYRLWKLQGGQWGMSFAHIGFGLIIAGGMGASVLTQEMITNVKIGETVHLNQYDFTLEAVASHPMENYSALRAKIWVTKDGEDGHYLYPERRRYVGGGMETTEAAIESGFLGDLYAVLGENRNSPAEDTTKQDYVLRVYIKPLVPYMWFGALMMVIGAVFSLNDRRLRLGVPKHKKIQQ